MSELIMLQYPLSNRVPTDSPVSLRESGFPSRSFPTTKIFPRFIDTKPPALSHFRSVGQLSTTPVHSLSSLRLEPCKSSRRKNGWVKAFAANTHNGRVRNYNEDRVSVVLSVTKPTNRQTEEWPKCSFFGLYDGHGGSACADFLRDSLHQLIIRDPLFPSSPQSALVNGLSTAESTFLCKARNSAEKSGSCALVTLIVEESCYVANIGDSRAVLSCDGGCKVIALSTDHKPAALSEAQRISASGGTVYQSSGSLTGPMRVLPGHLSVSRTVGDAHAKLTVFGGSPGVVIATPEIKTFRLACEHDFIVMCSDGVFDRLTNNEVVEMCWKALEASNAPLDKACASAVELVMTTALQRRCFDNITVVLVALPALKARLKARTRADFRFSER